MLFAVYFDGNLWLICFFYLDHLDYTWNDAGGPGGPATNPFLATASPPQQQTSQTQQIMDLFASPGGAAAPPPAAAPKTGGSALDDLLSLGLGNGTTSAPAAAPVASNPFADMFAASNMSQQPKPMNAYGGNGFGGAAQQGGFFQSQSGQAAPTIQQPFGGNNINAMFGSNNDQGKLAYSSCSSHYRLSVYFIVLLSVTYS